MFQDELRKLSDDRKIADSKKVNYPFGLNSENLDDMLIDFIIMSCRDRANDGKDGFEGCLVCNGDEYDWFNIEENDKRVEFVYDSTFNRDLKDDITKEPYDRKKPIVINWNQTEFKIYCVSGEKCKMELLAKAIQDKLVKQGLERVEVNVLDVNIIHRSLQISGLFKKKIGKIDRKIANGYRIYVDIRW